MRIREERQFTEDLASLPTHIQERAKQKLALFLENPRHPSLRVKKMEGWRDIWEAHITKEYCFTFEIVGDLYKLRRVGTHEIYRSP